MLRTLVAVLSALATACGGSSPSSPSPVPGGSSAGAGGSSSGGSTSTQCSTFGNRRVTVTNRSTTGIFTHAPFNASDLALITNGIETNDPRFSYQWVRNRGSAVDIYAPADGVLVRIRHKVPRAEFPSEDYDMFFLVACDPNRPGAGEAIVRFNHITDPRADIRAAYAFGALPAPEFGAGGSFDEREDRQVPTTNIAVRAGERLGSTRGTPTANNFDFMIAIDNVTVCPFTVLNEPHRAALLGLLGPQSASPAGPPVPGFACTGYGGAP